MIRKILIANRGEIAVRIIKTCQAMGIATVAVYSDADKYSLAVEMADEAFHIGASEPSESYLNIKKIILAATVTGADAIHPGFGFLAENAAFALQVEGNNLTFIGPRASAIEAMGDKRIAKKSLKDVPFVAGYIGEDQSDEIFVTEAEKIGYPIMVKAAAGGGGKGMRLVHEPQYLVDALASARRESQQAFGDDRLMLEKAILEPRHIEVQIFGDQHGNVIALGERECSIQRRHQKIVEETPSSALTPALRQKICDTAVSIAQQINYTNAGTIEFLLDKDGQFYFMEMNTRLQVEHPVTEMVLGIDLVRWQIDVARGYTLAEIIGEKPLMPKGHAIEVRVYAEDPANQFLPVIGKIAHFQPSPYVRTDSGIRSGDVITPFYDPMIAKVISYAETRPDAIRKLDYALSQTQLLGLTNNIAYLRRVLMDDEHLSGLMSTKFVDEHPQLLNTNAPLATSALIACALAQNDGTTHWRNNPNRPIKQTFTHKNHAHTVLLKPTKNGVFSATIGNKTYDVEVVARNNMHITLILDGHRQHLTVVNSDSHTWWVHSLDGTFVLEWVSPLPLPKQDEASEGSLRAPMPGKVIQVLVQSGTKVKKGDLLLVLEAMKMEHRIEAPYDGTVESIRYAKGDTVQADEILLALLADEKS
jgi:geranyl-CoA carboxylase alpha subunit